MTILQLREPPPLLTCSCICAKVYRSFRTRCRRAVATLYKGCLLPRKNSQASLIRDCCQFLAASPSSRCFVWVLILQSILCWRPSVILYQQVRVVLSESILYLELTKLACQVVCSVRILINLVFKSCTFQSMWQIVFDQCRYGSSTLPEIKPRLQDTVVNPERHETQLIAHSDKC